MPTNAASGGGSGGASGTSGFVATLWQPATSTIAIATVVAFLSSLMGLPAAIGSARSV